jgi:hypothetical protein
MDERQQVEASLDGMHPTWVAELGSRLQDPTEEWVRTPAGRDHRETHSAISSSTRESSPT